MKKMRVLSQNEINNLSKPVVLTQPDDMEKHTDYIVVKDFETAEKLSKSKIPSLRGKWIIVAPDGLKFLRKEDLSHLPQVKEIRSLAFKEGEEAMRKKIVSEFKKISKRNTDWMNKTTDIKEWAEDAVEYIDSLK